MTLCRILMLLIVSTSLTPEVFAEVEVSSRPSEVTVYAGSARVVRTGKVNLPEGESVLVFSGLPARLDESSLRLAAEGVPARLSGVRLRETFSNEIIQKMQKDLNTKIESLRDAKADLEDQVSARKAEAELLKELGDKAAKQTSQNVVQKGGTVADFTQSVASIGKRLIQLNTANRGDERKMRDLDKKIAALQAELNNSGGGDTRSRVVEASVDLKKAGELRFELSYLIYGASWQPVYDARLTGDGEKPKLKLTFLADVRQNTGENWNSVKLALSTARPNEGTQAPDPTQWWLDVRRNNIRRSERMSRNRKSAMSASAPASEDEASDAVAMEGVAAGSAMVAPEAMQFEHATTVSGEYATSFMIKGTPTVRNDGSAQRVSISESSHNTEIKLQVVPRLDKAAYVQARVFYDGDQPLMEGPLNLFQNDRFVGSTRLKPVAAGESFDLGLGKDDRLKVERERISTKDTQGSGFVFKKDSRKYHWLVKVKNLHKAAREVEVLEQLPRSRRDDIKVSEEELTPAPEPETADKRGLKRWILKLQPNEEKRITFRYEVKYPEGTDVVGLEY